MELDRTFEERTLIIPSDLSDVGSLVGSLGKVFDRIKDVRGSGPPVPPR